MFEDGTIMTVIRREEETPNIPHGLRLHEHGLRIICPDVIIGQKNWCFNRFEPLILYVTCTDSHMHIAISWDPEHHVIS